ncbi:hypothetical protein BTVI_144335 [Pitangus sulphuratus]|nr:hypothetical protein BTVI_144335 [Pitangus sulphuratus]
MVLVHHLLLLLILLTALHARAAQAATGQLQEAADSLKDSLTAWQKDGLELLEPADDEVGGLLKSLPIRVLKQKREPTLLSKSGEKHNGNAKKSPQMDSEHSEVTVATTTHVPKPEEHIESMFCRGAGCMIGIVIVLVAVPVGILLCTAAICWWCDRKRRLYGDRQERVGLMSRPDSPNSLSEPDPPL